MIISSNFTVDPLDLACDAVKLTLLSLNTYSCNRAHVRACLNLGTFWKYRLILLWRKYSGQTVNFVNLQRRCVVSVMLIARTVHIPNMFISRTSLRKGPYTRQTKKACKRPSARVRLEEFVLFFCHRVFHKISIPWRQIYIYVLHAARVELVMRFLNYTYMLFGNFTIASTYRVQSGLPLFSARCYIAM